MRILLVGEYSRLHNSLKEGLTALGNDVLLVGDGDEFKRYPVDLNIEPKISRTKFMNIPRQAIARIFKYDIAKTERGLRFYFLLKKLKDFDAVQLINEAPIKTTTAFERKLLSRLFRQNNKTFLLSCGIDRISMQFMLDRKFRYSLMDPYFADKSLEPQYQYMFGYMSKAHQKLHALVYRNIQGVIASDIDYVLPLKGHPKFLGLVPNPVNLQKLKYTEPDVSDKVIIFLGINRAAYFKKGIGFFEDALTVIKQKYGNRVNVIETENVPYAEYINLYNRAHILLDQVYGYDQGYNALEAMAKGKVVFTGAEKEFKEYYGLSERVAVNALPDVNSIVQELCYLIENPDEITAIGRRARAFIEKEHNHINVARKYLEKWGLKKGSSLNIQEVFPNK